MRREMSVERSAAEPQPKGSPGRRMMLRWNLLTLLSGVVNVGVIAVFLSRILDWEPVVWQRFFVVVGGWILVLAGLAQWMQRAVRALVRWLDLEASGANTAEDDLRAFAASIPEDDPTAAQLWPEHFDLAMSADRINYGGSPGDNYIDVPYLYVGPFDGPPAKPDPFWNQPFGAAIGFDEIASIQDAFEFFRRGRVLTRE